MHYGLNDEQTMLKDSLEGWLARHYKFEQERRLSTQAPSYSGEYWQQFAEMGWLGIGLPEELGGTGFGSFERMIIGESFGSRLVNEPYHSTVALGGGLLLRAGSDAQKSKWLPRVASGAVKLAFAFAEKQSRYFLNCIATEAKKAGDAWHLTGEKIVVLDAPSADRLIVLARTRGGLQDTDGLSLFLVDPKGPGVSVRSYSTVDDRRAADIVFEGAIAEDIMGAEGEAFAPVERVVDEAITYLCAEGVGAMQALLDLTVAHAKTRAQFGQPIGNFQAIQHRLAEMRVQIECARAMTVYAAATQDSPERARAASAAKVQSGKSGRAVGRNAVQLHGGMGMTDELPVGRYFKRLLMTETLLGDVAFHQQRFASFPSALA